jgi:flagellar biosynthetic protein FliR
MQAAASSALPTLAPLLPHAAPFLLVLARVIGLFLFAPLIATTSMPRQARVLMAVSFAAAIYPGIPPEAIRPVAADAGALDLATLAGLAFSEALIGGAIGLMAALPLFAMQMAGHLMGYQMGLSIAQAYNPELDAESGVTDQAVFILGVFMFVAVGGVEAMFLALAETFRAVPVGSFAVGESPLNAIVTVLAAATEFCLRLAAPVIAVLMLILIALGIIMKVIPQIHLMTVGFIFKILAGVLILALVLASVDRAGTEFTVGIIRDVHAWVGSLGLTQPHQGGVDG